MAKTNANKGNTRPEFMDEHPEGTNLTPETAEKKDQFIKELTAGVDEPFQNFKEPESGEVLERGSGFWNWRDENDKGFIGRIFVGQYLGVHEDPREGADFTKPLGYDFKGADGKDYIVGDNYQLTSALSADSPKVKGKAVKDTAPWLWMKLLRVDESKRGDINIFKIVLMDSAPKLPTLKDKE